MKPALLLAAAALALMALRRPRPSMPAVPAPELPEPEEEGLYAPMTFCGCGTTALYCAAHGVWSQGRLA
jgi:hypothetical protein